jgi:hypothetical protein
MKKIVRLTENDLARIVKKVLKEQSQSDLESKVKGCIMSTFELKDISKVPMSCVSVGLKLFKGGLPNPLDPENMECAQDLMKDPMFVLKKFKDITGCLAKQSPVMF